MHRSVADCATALPTISAALISSRAHGIHGIHGSCTCFRRRCCGCTTLAAERRLRTALAPPATIVWRVAATGGRDRLGQPERPLTRLVHQRRSIANWPWRTRRTGSWARAHERYHRSGSSSESRESQSDRRESISLNRHSILDSEAPPSGYKILPVDRTAVLFFIEMILDLY